MKLSFLILLCAFGLTSYAQSSKELIGKWKLVKETTTTGVVKTPEYTYQVFLEGGEFLGINGKDSRKGKWILSADNKTLTIKISIVSVKFSVDYFDAKKRIITSDKIGTLEYEKVAD
jgi:hypothetical protein